MEVLGAISRVMHIERGNSLEDIQKIAQDFIKSDAVNRIICVDGIQGNRGAVASNLELLEKEKQEIDPSYSLFSISVGTKRQAEVLLNEIGTENLRHPNIFYLIDGKLSLGEEISPLGTKANSELAGDKIPDSSGNIIGLDMPCFLNGKDLIKRLLSNEVLNENIISINQTSEIMRRMTGIEKHLPKPFDGGVCEIFQGRLNCILN